MKQRKKKKSIGIVKTVIFGRTAMILLGFLAQLAVLALGYIRLKDYSFLFFVLFASISVIAVLHIFNTGGNPDMKLSWMFPIVLFPVFGAVFYTTIIMQPGLKVMYQRLLKQFERTREHIRPDRKAWEGLRNENPSMAQFTQYLWNFDNSPVYQNTKVAYFPLGDEMFPAMKEELEKAEKYIFMEYFIICDGRVWNEIHEILRRKAKEGVEIRLMYDGTNVLFNFPNYYHKLLEKEGISCRLFEPIKPVFSPHYNNRDHRKILVVDGKVAFTGGINLADEYINEKSRFGHWKDTGILVKGAAVERFTYMFLEMWNESEKQTEDYGKYAHLSDDATSSDGYVIPYSVCPLGEERVGERVFLDIINTAHTYVHIMTPYLVLDHQLMTALSFAAKRGVKVVIIMPHIPDKRYVFDLAKTYYNQLLESGVRICEYEPGFVHAKVVVADDEKAVVGTVNFDYRSLYHHFECGLILYRNSQIAEIERDVQNTLEHCLEQRVEDYKKISLLDRGVGRIMRIIAPLM